MPHCVCRAARCMVEANLSPDGTVRPLGRVLRVQPPALARCALRLDCWQYCARVGPSISTAARAKCCMLDCTPLRHLLIRSWMTGTTFLTKSSGALSAAAHSRADPLSAAQWPLTAQLFVPTLRATVRPSAVPAVRPSAVPADALQLIRSNRSHRQNSAQTAQESAAPRTQRMSR